MFTGKNIVIKFKTKIKILVLANRNQTLQIQKNKNIIKQTLNKKVNKQKHKTQYMYSRTSTSR